MKLPITREMVEQMPEEERAVWEEQLERQEAHERYFHEKLAARDWGGALALRGSEEVGGFLVQLAPNMSDEELKEILKDEWTRIEAHAPYRDELIALFRRTGF